MASSSWPCCVRYTFLNLPDCVYSLSSSWMWFNASPITIASWTALDTTSCVTNSALDTTYHWAQDLWRSRTWNDRSSTNCGQCTSNVILVAKSEGYETCYVKSSSNFTPFWLFASLLLWCLWRRFACDYSGNSFVALLYTWRGIVRLLVISPNTQKIYLKSLDFYGFRRFKHLLAINHRIFFTVQYRLQE